MPKATRAGGRGKKSASNNNLSAAAAVTQKKVIVIKPKVGGRGKKSSATATATQKKVVVLKPKLNVKKTKKKKKQQRRTPPPPPNPPPLPKDYVCRICNIPGHHITDCPEKGHRQNSRGRGGGGGGAGGHRAAGGRSIAIVKQAGANEGVVSGDLKFWRSAKFKLASKVAEDVFNMKQSTVAHGYVRDDAGGDDVLVVAPCLDAVTRASIRQRGRFRVGTIRLCLQGVHRYTNGTRIARSARWVSDSDDDDLDNEDAEPRSNGSNSTNSSSDIDFVVKVKSRGSSQQQPRQQRGSEEEVDAEEEEHNDDDDDDEARVQRQHHQQQENSTHDGDLRRVVSARVAAQAHVRGGDGGGDGGGVRQPRPPPPVVGAGNSNDGIVDGAAVPSGGSGARSGAENKKHTRSVVQVEGIADYDTAVCLNALIMPATGGQHPFGEVNIVRFEKTKKVRCVRFGSLLPVCVRILRAITTG